MPKRRSAAGPAGPAALLSDLTKSDDAHVLRLFAFSTRSYVKFDGLAFLEGCESLAVDVGVVNKDVICAFA